MSLSEDARWFTEGAKPDEPALRAYLLRRFPAMPDHDDLVQDTYVRLIRARARGRLNYTRALLFAVARSVAIDWFRRRGKRPHEPLVENAELPALDETRDAAAALEHRQRLALLVEAVGALPRRCREVMILRHVEGLSYREISERLAVSPETVKTHAARGLRMCIAYFRDRGMLDGGLFEAVATETRPGGTPSEREA